MAAEPIERDTPSMERIDSPQIGFGIGLQNGRSMLELGEGRAQERNLVTNYRDRAKQHAFDYSYVSGVRA